MEHHLTDWLNRIGLLTGFFSFWFAAPELIGEQRLKEWAMALARVVPSGAQKATEAIRITLFVIIGLSVYAIAVCIVGVCMSYHSVRSHDDSRGSLICVSIGTAIVTVMALFIAVRARRLVRGVNGYVNRKAISIISRLANDSQRRQTSLFIGAWLFIISFIVQMLATVTG
jgi:hypothetical protein